MIGIREGLEGALVIGILVAYVVKIDRRDVIPRIWAGVGLAVALSLAVGAALTYGTADLSESAQEAIGGTVAVLATALVTVMVFWMLKTARHLKGNLTGDIDRHLAGAGLGLVLVAFLAIGREGIETALFIFSAAQFSGASTFPLLGAALGIATAAVLGWLIFRGMVKINLARFFAWSGGLLLVLAAGVLADGVGDLQKAGILPGANSIAFDVSTAIPTDSWYGMLLKGTVNFSPVTTWLEAAVWLAYFVPVIVIFVRTVRRSGPPAVKPSAPVREGSLTTAS